MINSPSVMIMKAVLLLPLLRCAADLDFHARMQASLEASLAQYPAVPKSTEAVSRYLAGVLFAPTFSVLVYEGRLFVDRRFLGAEKNRKHANFVASALAHEHVHNAAYFFSGNSTGLCDRDRDRDAPVAPCLVIAKVGGHGMRGVLVPNPYFQDVGYWDAVRSHVRARAATRPFAGRDPRLFWRGSVRSSCGPGNVARVAALTLTAQHPDRYDVRVTHGLDAPDAKACAREFPYTKAMVDLSTGKIPAPTGGFVNASEFSRWRRYLNLPGTMGGSYSRNLNLLWPLGGAVALWDGSAVEWYYPGLREGETHAALDETSAGAALDALDAGEAALAAAAGAVHETFLAGGSLDRYWRLLVDKLRARFRLGDVLDDLGGAAAAVALAGVDCGALRRVYWHSPDRPFFDETPGLGKPVAYAALDDGDPLLVACRRAKKKTR